VECLYKIIRVIDSDATGFYCRIAREKKLLPLRKISKRMGISAMYLSQLERGERNWNERLMKKFNQALKA